MKLQLPDIYTFESSHTYILEFVRLNRNADDFSLRSFAKALKWPIGYLNDVIKGRKRLTAERAMQFGVFVGLSDLQQTRLMYMCLADTRAKSVGNFFKKLIADETDPGRQMESPHSRKYHENIEYPLVLELAKWSRGKITLDTLAELLPTFPNMTKEKLKVLVSDLQQQGILSVKNELVTALESRLKLDESGPNGGVDINRKYAENFIRHADNFRAPSCFNSGFVEFRRSEFMEIAGRLIALRNWLLKKGDQLSETQKEKGNETYVFQFDVNLFPILETRRLKDWDPFGK